MNLSAKQKLRYRCREQRYGYQGGGWEGGRGLDWETGTGIYARLYIK